jgi:hypothetical protein
MKKLSRRFETRVDDQTARKLAVLARNTGLTRSEIVRLLILRASSRDLKICS